MLNPFVRLSFSIFIAQAGLGVMWLGLNGWTPQPTYAAPLAVSIGVTTITDELTSPGTGCSLREAIMNANNNDNAYPECGTGAAGADTLNIPAGVYTLTLTGAGEDFNATGDLDVVTDTAGVILNGTGATSATVVLVGSGDRVLHAPGATTPVTLTNLTIRGGSVSDSGGGAYFGGPAYVIGATFMSNTAAITGGGATFENTASVIGTTFMSNTASATNGNIGGALFNNTASVVGTTFTGNTANYRVGGAHFYGPAYVTGTTFTGNTADSIGGAIFNDTVSMTGTTFTGNTATTGSTGGAIFNDTVNMTGTTFISNTAATIGGAVFFNWFNSKQLVNVLFAGNRAAGKGAAIYVSAGMIGPLSLIHTTIVSPTAPTGGTQAIYVAGGVVGGSGTVYLTNTLIASHTIGIERFNNTSDTVIEDYTLFSDVATPYIGTILSGGHSITGPAAFADAQYRLSASSAAIDKGVEAGVTTDYFGNARPQGPAPDIGYAERITLYLPLILKNLGVLQSGDR